MTRLKFGRTRTRGLRSNGSSRRNGCSSTILLLLLYGLTASATGCRAKDGGLASMGSHSAVKASLLWQKEVSGPGHGLRVDFPGAGFTPGRRVSAVTFEALPDFEGRKVFHGVLHSQVNRRESIGFVWDPKMHRLHIDSNDNRDLRDDAPFEAKTPGGMVVQSFKPVRLRRRMGATEVPYDLEVTLLTYGKDRRGGFARILSGWVGRAELGGEVVRLAMKPMSLRPVADSLRLGWRRQSLGGNHESEDWLRAPSRFHTNNGSYDVTYTVGDQDGRSVLGMTFTPANRPHGRIRIEGAYLRRIVLAQSRKLDQVVMLDLHHGKEQTIPAGTYDVVRAFLEDKNPSGSIAGFLSRVTVKEGATTLLVAGGPLHNEIKVKAAKDRLLVNHAVVGRGGKIYHGSGARPKVPPRFSVRLGSKPVFSASFSYG